MRQKILLLSLYSLFFIVCTSFVTDGSIDKHSSAPTVRVTYKHYHYFYNSQPWYDNNFCKHWLSVEVEFDYDGTLPPINIQIHQPWEYIDCHHVVSPYARSIHTMTFDANAHVTSLAFDATGDPTTDAKLSDPVFLSDIMDGMNAMIDGMK